MADPKVLTNIDRRKLNLFRSEMAKLAVYIPEGDDVDIKAMFGVRMHATYDETSQTLTLEITDKPIFVPESQIWSFVESGATRLETG